MAFDEYKRINDIKNEIGLPGLNETTQDQVFFISFGQAWCSKMPYPTYLELQMRQDPHAQERFRVVSSLKHATDFAKAFKVKLFRVFMNSQNYSSARLDLE